MVSTSGFMIGVIGGILDFASATSLLLGGSGQENPMARAITPNPAWVLGLYILGTLVIISTVLSVMSMGFRFSRPFAILMIVYGIVMIGSGWLMITGKMQGTELLLYGYGMVILGGLMIVNGSSMARVPLNV